MDIEAQLQEAAAKCKTLDQLLLCVSSFDHQGVFVRKLLEKNVNVDVTDEEGQTPLVLSCKTNAVNSVRLLIEWGADVDAMAAARRS